MKGLVWWLVFFFSGSFLVDHAKGAAADADATATIQKGLIHNLLRGEVPSHDIVKEDVATSTRARVTEHQEGEMASAIGSADRHQKKHLLQQVDEEGEYYNPTEWWKNAVDVSSEEEDVNNATSTSTVDRSMVVRSGQESHVTTTIASVNTTSHGGDVACKVDKSILVMTHVLGGAFGLEHSPAFTIANRLYMALDMNGQRKLDQVLYEIPTELGLQHFTVKMLEMFRHAINDLGMVFTIEQVAMVHETFAPVVVEIMKFMYQVDGYPDKGMYSLASYMNSTVSLMDTLQQSIRSCFQHVTHCHDNSDYYYFDDTSFCLRTCALIGRLDITRRLAMCQKQEVMDNCPYVCGTCCEDDPSYEIIVQNNTAGYIRGCSWLTEDPNMAETRRAMYCDDITEEDGRMIRHYCPLSCDSCVINGPTLAPTLAPTATPTNSNAPTLTPIEETQPPVHDPTLAPTVQVLGNCKAYTSNIGQGSANNSVCEQAFHLSTDSSLVCGEIIENQTFTVPPVSCSIEQTNQGPPSWYTLEGTGERIVITTCAQETTFDTLVSVYEFALCSSTSCQPSIIHDVRIYPGVFKSWTFPSLAANDDDDTCIETGTGASTVVFDSVAGQMYKLYVSEKGPGRQGGTFGLKATSMMAPANDRCETAINLNTDGVEVIGSTVNATIDWQVVESCAFSQQNIRGASVWYTLEGTGERIVITTCSRLTDMNTILAVYDQSHCNSYTCLASTIHDVRIYPGVFKSWTFPSLAANDDDATCIETGTGASTVVFDSVAGQMYKLYVSEKGPGRQGGTFGLKATSMMAPANDRCETAINLNTDGVEVIGSTVNATIDWEVVESCAFSQQNIRGASVWYTLEGTGERIVITTCSRLTDMNTILAVYDQSHCNSNICLASTIHDVREYSGIFKSWTFPSLAANDDDDTCIETGTGASTVVFDSVAGQRYKLYVSEKGPGRQGGTFGLKATSMMAPANDRCETAINLNTDGVEVIGSTVNATIDWQVVESCAFSQQNIRGASVWYTLEGTGERIVITTCSRLTDMNTILAVYDQSHCNSYNCLASTIHDVREYSGVFKSWTFPSLAANDDDATCIETGTGASTVVFDSVAGQMYKLYVSEKGPGRQGGTFGLKATSMMAPANDRCETAINLNTDGVEVIGSTVNATIDWEVVESCAFSQQNIRGASVWYRLQGTGGKVQVTTCSMNTTFDTVLAVYNDGFCDKFTCFVSNDNDSACNITGVGASTVTFDTVSGQIYKFYVSSKSRTSEGQFGLIATTVDDWEDV